MGNQCSLWIPAWFRADPLWDGQSDGKLTTAKADANAH